MLKRILLAAAFALLPIGLLHAQKISDLPAGTALGGTEMIPAVQSSATKRITPAQIKTYVIGAGSVSVASGKTLTASNTLTFAGTDSSTLNVGTGGTLGTAAYTAATAYEVPLTFSTGLTRSTNTVTVNTSQNIATLSNLTSNGLVTTSGGAGTLGVTAPGTGVLTALGNTLNASGGLVGFSGTLGTPTGTSIALSGCTIGSDKLCVTGSSTFGGAVTVSGSSFTLSGNQSSAAWTTGGLRHKNVAATLTDTSSSGTVAAAYSSVWGGNTIAASSATTFTNYYEAYFQDPIAGSNVTLTNKWALGADSIRLAGQLHIAGNGTAAAPAILLGGTTSAGIFGVGAANGALVSNSSKILQWDTTTAYVNRLNFDIANNDIGLSRVSANILGVGTGAAGSFAGTLKLTTLQGGTTLTLNNASSGTLTFGSNAVTPASSGTRYLCIGTTGTVTSSASACSGT